MRYIREVDDPTAEVIRKAREESSRGISVHVAIMTERGRSYDSEGINGFSESDFTDDVPSKSECA